jgi:hypothetical protein
MIDKKVCYACGDEKNIDSFYRSKVNSDGRIGKCKACRLLECKEYRHKNIDRVREHDRERKAGRVGGYEETKLWRKRHPEKLRAQKIASRAVRDGLLTIETTCQGDGCDFEGDLHKHHDDYSKPLDVKWLCPSCHHSLCRSV